MSTFTYTLIWVIGVLLILVYRGYRRYDDKNYFFLGSEMFEVFAVICWPVMLPGFLIINLLIKICIWLGNKLDYLGKSIACKLDKDSGSIED